MSADLILTSTQGTEDTECQQFPCLQMQSTSYIYITKTIRRKITLNMLLIIRHAFLHSVNHITKNKFLYFQPFCIGSFELPIVRNIAAPAHYIMKDTE